jgi:maleylpyruvate isomerase
VQRPSADLEALRGATRRFLLSVERLSDDDVQSRSRLPDWNRAEVITHVARNADGIRGMVDGAARNEVVAMYPGGLEARADGIAAGRDERQAVLLADVRRASDNLAEAFGKLPDDAWDRVGQASVKRTMHELPWVRWREVEMHHLDLDAGYEASDWPVPFVSSALREIFGTFPQRRSPQRPRDHRAFRIGVTDHERWWRVALDGDDVTVQEDDDRDVDGEARGWGCDVVAWLYGRDPRGGGIVASGDLDVLRLPRWFPYA